MIERIVLAAALVLLGSQAVGAQMHPMMHEQVTDPVPSMEMARGMMMGGMMGQGMGMMDTGGPGPATLLRMRKALDLTDEQGSALESMLADLQAEMQGRMTAMMTAHQAAAAALDSEAPKWDAYEGNLEAAAGIMVQAHVMMARVARDARDDSLEAAAGPLTDGCGWPDRREHRVGRFQK